MAGRRAGVPSVANGRVSGRWASRLFVGEQPADEGRANPYEQDLATQVNDIEVALQVLPGAFRTSPGSSKSCSA